MKVLLQKHIEDVFSSCKIVESFNVLDCEHDTLPEWSKHISMTHQYLIYCDYSFNKESLQRFLGKEVHRYEGILYWFEGDEISKEELVKLESAIGGSTIKRPKIDYLKTTTRLPQWLDDYIFKELKAEYSPDFQRFGCNLDLNKNEILNYLGTYFPRSYGESFCIFDNIFQNAAYRGSLKEKGELNILSVGCGTGGDLIGLITVIEKYYSNISKINIYAIDGNVESLDILTKIIDKFSTIHSTKIQLNISKIIFSSIVNIDFGKIKSLKFDFILSFKMICEIIMEGQGENDNSYYEFVMKFISLLSEEGLFVLLDVTTKPNHIETYNPILKNIQVNTALREYSGRYKTLLPLACCKNEKHCNQQCFTQQIFYISHSKATNDLSKVSYRIIANALLVNSLISNQENVKYVLQGSEKNTKRTFCPHSNGEEVVDGYKL